MDINKKLVEYLIENKYRITTAESITGGKVINSLIEIPGASNVTEQSYIVYSDSAKIDVLGIEASLIETFGVVSEEVALQMARSAKKLAKADIAISTTGEAGPITNSKDIKAGTVCFGLIIEEEEISFTKVFNGDRLEIIDSAKNFILNELFAELNKQE